MSDDREDLSSLTNVERAGYTNILAIRDYSTETRKQVRDLERQVKELKNMIIQQNQVIERQSSQIVVLLKKIV